MTAETGMTAGAPAGRPANRASPPTRAVTPGCALNVMSRYPPVNTAAAAVRTGSSQRPGYQLQIDVKFVEPVTADAGRKKRYYQYTAIDDCTSLRILRIYPRSDQKTAVQFLDYVLSRLPFQVEKIQTDNGAECQSAFHWHLLDQGIGDVYVRPATPRLNGKGRAFASHRRRGVLPPA
ncbi:DDE-type integrase/transposase/recombinase [Amycolatopsis sp. NPDC004169]|uniref:DDE-type integrase/transposase/recombinase n=1 Tax=Amycolatopsis sp. NPDC004169 TaxID=3154453 RepID=UPI0033A3A672